MVEITCQKSLEFLIKLTLTGFLVAHVWEQMVKHLEGRTLTIEELYQYPQIKLPAFTICADEHYKQPGHFFNHSSYLENTYQYEEIFHESNLAKLQSKGFSMREIRSAIWGQCFTFTSDHDFVVREEAIVTLVPDPPEVSLFVHAQGEEFWLLANHLPFDVEVEDGMEATSECTIRQEDFVTLNYPSKNKHCKYWNLGDFFQCAADQLSQAIVEQDFSCHTVWWKEYFPENVPECTFNDSNEIERLGQWFDDGEAFPIQFVSRPWFYGCPFLCEYGRYKLNCHELVIGNDFTFLHNKSQTGTPAYIRIRSLSNGIELEEELFLHDFSGIVAGVGGSLGLFLGFSGLQASFSVLDLLFRLGNKSKEGNGRGPKMAPIKY